MGKVAIAVALLFCLYIYLFVISSKPSDDIKRKPTLSKKLKWRKNLKPTTKHVDVVQPPVSNFKAVQNGHDLKSIKASLLNQENTMHLAKRSKPLLTIFTTWNDNPEKYLVHNLTSNNWMKFRPYIIPVVFTNETSVAKACKKKGWKVHHVREAAARGIPRLKYMYIDAMEHYDSVLYSYCNSDILFTENLIHSLYSLIKVHLNVNKPVLLVGRRTDVLNMTTKEGYSWTNIKEVAKKRGKLHPDCGIDYFITSPSFPWKDIAPVIIGHIVYDNYMLYYSRKANFTVIDTTNTILAVHQSCSSPNYKGYYNLDILQQMYQHTRFWKETTTCIKKYTYYKQGTVEVAYRKIEKPCEN